MIEFIGTRFPRQAPWGRQEHFVLDQILEQIQKRWPQDQNLVINATWMGPSFNNGLWDTVQNLHKQKQKFDRIFWIAPVDPVFFDLNEIDRINQQLDIKETYRVGISLGDGPYEFNTGAIACLDEFHPYQDHEIVMTGVKYVYMCLNRKPKTHRIRMVESLHQAGLEKLGLLSLGANDQDYDVSEGVNTEIYINPEPDADYSNNGFYKLEGSNLGFGGVPADLSSLGPLSNWQQHFLNIVSETVWRPWDPVFVTEKTWKPIIGLRPFVINGQTTVYEWLRRRGFRTFNHVWPVDVEHVHEDHLQSAIVDLVKGLSQQNLVELYCQLLPDLQYNRDRFFEFAREQKNHVTNLFK
jgi:hypothetical protein